MTEREFLLTSVLNCERVDLYVDPPPWTSEQKVRLAEFLSRRQNGEPLQYVLGCCEFMGLKFFVDPRVFIPRPETELLVELAIQRIYGNFSNRPIKILDLGTGSGNMAVSLAKFIQDCEVTAVESSLSALAVAQNNARTNGVADKIIFLGCDMKSFLTQAAQPKFDVIISNPPYIPTHRIPHLPLEVQYEPWFALDGGEDGMDFYRVIIQKAGTFLAPGGFVMMEIGEDQGPALEKICTNFWPDGRMEFQKDYCERERMATITKNGKLKAEN